MKTKQNILKSREKFVKEVANVIRENHFQNGDESFIFGISGKWGEGKTEFLKGIKTELNQEFVIVELNAWKFAQDKISFLRNFIFKILKSSSTIEKLSNKFNGVKTTEDLFFDYSENKFNIGKFSLMILVFLILATTYVLLPVDVKLSIKSLEIFFTVMAIPIVIYVVQTFITVTKSSHSIVTLDKFDEMVQNILKKYKEQKILVLIDDLDRVTPEVARNVLDNLRTFFDKPELSFIVTGDHTVLERYLGRDLLPESDGPEQLEEGKRFLKKIFNVYWRLPMPIEKEMNDFLDDLIKNNLPKLNKIFKKDGDLDIYKRYLNNYFDRNFRQIIRFIELTIFTFNIINNFSEIEEKQKKYLEELIEFPLLVIRVLMIQELCPPIFEEIIHKPDILFNLERQMSRGNGIDNTVNAYEKNMSKSQLSFIKKFIFDKPRFFENNLLVVSDIRPFLYLVADAGFGDSRGILADDFVPLIQIGDSNNIKQALIGSGEKRIKESIIGFIKLLDDTPEPAKKMTFLNNLLITLDAINDKDIPLHSIVLGELEKIDINFFKDIGIDEKTKIIRLFFRWLDNFKSENLTIFKDKFNIINRDDIHNLYLDHPELKNINRFESSIIISWFLRYYNENRSNALVVFSKLLHLINQNDLKINLKDIEDSLFQDFKNDTQYREEKFNIIKNLPDVLSNVKIFIFNKISELNEEYWQFAFKKIDENTWGEDDLEKQLVDMMPQSTNRERFKQLLRFSVNKINKLKVSYWKKIIENHLSIFFTIIPEIINDNFYQSIMPDNENCGIIFYKLLDVIAEYEDSQRSQWLEYLNRTYLLWKNLDKIDGRKLAKLRIKDNENINLLVDKISKSWGIKKD